MVETSWDFKVHFLVPKLNEKDIRGKGGRLISEVYGEYLKIIDARFINLRDNEIKLNEILIDIYGLKNDLDSIPEEDEITLKRVDVSQDIKSLISYAIGCMFGRYSLDTDGIVFAGGDWSENKYKIFIPDTDNCIPITDEEYFGDDIVGRFIEFIRVVYGEDTLEENIEYIANVIGNKGNTSREIIRNYFVKDFYKDHVKTYKKRPIYWLYDSGKQDGFKALVYMHRYTADTTGIVRVDYLHKMQKIYMSEIDRMKEMTENSSNAREVAQAEKRREKLIKQLKETKEYDEKIAHLALSRVAIDFDDGVSENYEKVQTGKDGKKLAVLMKI